MGQLTILYELPQPAVVSVVKDTFYSDSPDEHDFGPDALEYVAGSERWEFQTHRHPSRQELSEETFRVRVPRHRVYRVVLMEPFSTGNATTKTDSTPDSARYQELAYEADGEDEPTVVDGTEVSIIEPIRFNEESGHWRYRTHDELYSEGGETFTYSHWIPNERVYYALE